jgi:Xaa-Pro aminopeptidase
MNIARSRGLTTPLTADEELIKAARDRGITFEVKNVDAIVSAMRRIKSQYEIQTLQRAIDITGEALKETMRSIEPGMYEYQLQAIIEYVFAFNNSKKVGFTTICGSGPNSINLHWSINDRQMQDGDVVVCDIGADYNGYTGDLTRTLPVNGKFTPRQKAIYEIVLSAQEAAKAVMKPGMSFSKVDSAANKALSDGLIRLGLIKDARTELRKYYTHGLSHSIGLTVHDVGGLGTLEPGMIITIEPGLYVKEENIGIRIEDDFLITDNGCIRLSENVPRTVADVETLCKEKGLDFQRYLIKK